MAFYDIIRLGGYMYSNNLICDIVEFINQNINREITILELSNRFFFDKTYIMKRFKKELGLSIHDYINKIRILNSLSQYKYDNYILNIALKNGFNSIEYYSEIFKKIIGVNPLKYKKFVNRSVDITDKEINIILNNINNCNNVKNNAENYISRRKPTTIMVKSLKIDKGHGIIDL